MIRLIASDIDGTLLPYDETVMPQRLFPLIRRLRERNILFCPASGRQYHSMRTLFAPVADEMCFLCENGAVLYGPGTEEGAPLLSKTLLPRQEALALSRAIMDIPGCDVIIEGQNLNYLCGCGPELVHEMAVNHGNLVTMVDRPEDVPEEIVKIAAYCPNGMDGPAALLAPPLGRAVPHGGGGPCVAGLLHRHQGHRPCGDVRRTGRFAGGDGGLRRQLERSGHAGHGGPVLSHGAGGRCAAPDAGGLPRRRGPGSAPILPGRVRRIGGDPLMRAVIFDLDGVLVRTDQAHDKAWRALAVRLGIPFDGRAAARLRGVSRMEALDIVLEGCGRSFTPAEKEALAAEKNERYRALIAEMTPADVAPDTTVTLKALRERGLLLAVASSSKNARFILGRTGLTPYFHAVVDGTQIARSKPDPEVFLKAAQALGVSQTEALVVEDAAAGVRAARCGGFSSAALGPAAAAEGLADHEIRSLPELLELV